MELIPGIIAAKGALFLQESRTLILSDLHIGFEQELRDGGAIVIEEQREFFEKEIAALLEEFSPAHVILNGDIKHEFGRITQQEWSGVMSIIRLLQKESEVLLIGGNHDNMIKPIAKKLELEIKPYIILQSILITHGDRSVEELDIKKEEFKKVTTIIIGHEHPSLGLSDGVRKERAKCYLVGKHRRKNLVVMPSFNPLTYGTDMLRERPLGPLLTTTSGFSAFALIEEGVLAFGSIEHIQRH